MRKWMAVAHRVSAQEQVATGKNHQRVSADTKVVINDRQKSTQDATLCTYLDAPEWAIVISDITRNIFLSYTSY